MPEMLAAKTLPDVSAPRFNIVTKALSSAGETDGRMRFRATASSSITDRAGDEISLAALQKMAGRFREGLTIFMDHDYLHVDSAFGTTDGAEILQRGTDPKSGMPIWDLDIEGFVNEPNPRAVQLWKSIDGGYVKFGASINAFVLDHKPKAKGAGLLINDLDVFEASIVGVPMNQRSWVQKAVKAIKSFHALPDEDEDEETPSVTKQVEAAPETEAVSETDAIEATETIESETTEKALDAEAVADDDVEMVATKVVDETAAAQLTEALTAPAETVEKTVDPTSAITGGQEADAATPETAPAETEGDETAPADEQKVATVPAGDVAALVQRVTRLVEVIGEQREEIVRLKSENADLQSKVASLTEVETQVELARDAIGRLMDEPLRPKTAGFVESFVERFPQFDPRIAQYLNSRGEE